MESLQVLLFCVYFSLACWYATEMGWLTTPVTATPDPISNGIEACPQVAEEQASDSVELCPVASVLPTETSGSSITAGTTAEASLSNHSPQVEPQLTPFATQKETGLDIPTNEMGRGDISLFDIEDYWEQGSEQPEYINHANRPASHPTSSGTRLGIFKSGQGFQTTQKRPARAR